MWPIAKPTAKSFSDFGGMFQERPDNSVEIRALRLNPYQGESALQIVQGFPMLLNPPGERARTGEGFDDRRGARF